MPDPTRRRRSWAAALWLVSAAAVAHARPAPTAPPWTWWEAERPRASNFPPGNPFAPPDAAAAAALSEGKWIGATDAGKALFLEYDVTVAADGSYQFFARKFWKHGPFRWRFDQQPWRTCGRDVALLDQADLAPFVSVSWVRLGDVPLARGKHTLRIELLEPKGPVAFDCFVLTTSPFAPRGKLKPDQKVGAAPEGWFPFEPDLDRFAPSPLDLRRLNEAHAGDGGFIQARGDSFVHASSGRPIRFWAVDVGVDALGYDRPYADRLARFLAKFGVNLVRFHGYLWTDGDVARIDPVKLDGLHRLTAALGAQGIYLELSTYFPLWLKPSAGPGFEGYDGAQAAFGLSYWSPSLQAMQRRWWREILTAPNRYTGRPLARDPTLAMFEIVNEDSLLFWTFAPYRGVPAPQMEVVERRFGEWLRAKYGSLAGAFARWGGRPVAGDRQAEGRAGLMPLWEIVKRRDERAQDTATFLAELQRRYYDDMSRYLKQELGFQGSVTGSNWVTADARTLGPLDKWSNAGCDFMDRHGYFAGVHEGERATFAISNGDRYADALALRFETGKPGESSFALPFMDTIYDGKPSTISEVAWTPPNRYRTDLPALAAAYGALQGTDAFVFFAGGEPTWAQSISKFTISDPAVLGQFPAAALIYREGLVKEAGAVVRLGVDLRSLTALEGLPLAAPQNLDALRAQGILPRLGWSKPAGPLMGRAVDPLAYLVGRVEVDVAAPPARVGPTHMADLSAFIDRNAKVVRSETGELRWDWGRGLATIDAPAAQGLTGLLRDAGPVALRDVTLSSSNEYGSILVVALDGRPLATSGRILVQVMTEDANTGWSATGAGLRTITSVGGPPIVVRKLAGRVVLHRRDAAALAVTALDFNGYPSAPPVPLPPSGELSLAPTTLYYLISAKE
jgi:hypothetical protein